MEYRDTLCAWCATARIYCAPESRGTRVDKAMLEVRELLSVRVCCCGTHGVPGLRVAVQLTSNGALGHPSTALHTCQPWLTNGTLRTMLTMVA